MRKIIPILSFILFVLAACDNRPGGVLSSSEMADVMTDIYKGEAMVDLSFGKFREDSSRARIREAVYIKHGLTQEQFDSSLSYYGKHIDEYVELHDEIIGRLELESKQLGRRASGDSHIGGDSVNVWQYSSRYVLTDKKADEYIHFNLARDENWEPGDNYTWQFKLFNRMSKVNLGMYVDYDDGSTDILNSVADKDGWNRVTINMDTTRTPVAVYGFVKFDVVDGEMVFVDSLSLVRKRFDDRAYRRRFNASRFVYGTDKINNNINADMRKRPVLRQPGL